MKEQFEQDEWQAFRQEEEAREAFENEIDRASEMVQEGRL